jgi:hypothetical protein
MQSACGRGCAITLRGLAACLQCPPRQGPQRRLRAPLSVVRGVEPVALDAQKATRAGGRSGQVRRVGRADPGLVPHPRLTCALAGLRPDSQDPVYAEPARAPIRPAPHADGGGRGGTSGGRRWRCCCGCRCLLEVSAFDQRWAMQARILSPRTARRERVRVAVRTVDHGHRGRESRPCIPLTSQPLAAGHVRCASSLPPQRRESDAEGALSSRVDQAACVALLRCPSWAAGRRK